MPIDRDDAFEWPQGDARLLLIFDGHCGVCTRLVEWVQRRDHARRVLLLPSQTPGLVQSVGLTQAEADREAWAIDGSGRAYGGAAAINRTLRELHGPWSMIGRAYTLPGVRQCGDAGYRWFARHRHWFSRWGVVPACARPGARCVS